MNKPILTTTISAIAVLALGACNNAPTVDSAAVNSAAGAAKSVVAQATGDLMANLTLPDLGDAPIGDKAPNYIFMIGDDMGLETLNCYSVGNSQAHTPNLDKLCASGLRFDNFWAQPVCSPTRATLITGQYGFLNGVGAPLDATPGIDWKVPEGIVVENPALEAINAAGAAEAAAAAGMGDMGAGDMGAGGMGDAMGGDMGGGDMGAGDMGAGGMGDMGAGGMGDMGAGGMGMGAAPSVAVVYEKNLTDGAPAPIAPTINSPEGLKPGIYSFVEALRSDSSKNYATAAVGKWHLAGSKNGGLSHPNIVGFDHYIGPMRGGGIATYTEWSKSINGGDPFWTTGYATTDTIDDSIEWINTVKDEQPFFLWLAFNAPHTPFHMPPAELLASNLKNLTVENSTPQQQYLALLESMDTEIGRLVSSLDPETLANTYISFMGDNGTPGQAEPTEPYGRQRSKGSMYQGGVNVPFFIAGPGIKKGITTPALSNSVDIYSTVLDISGVNDPKAASEAVHSVSLKPVMLEDPNTQVRDFAFADVFGLSGPVRKNLRTIRNDRFKLIENIFDNTVEFYDLSNDPYENANLMSRPLSATQQSNFDSLRQQIADLANGQ